MKDSIVVKLPYPYFIFGITISVKREFGFLFTNQSIYNYRENVGIKDSAEYEKWVKENGDARLISEMLYGAAQAYYQRIRKRQPFTKSKLVAALAAAPIDIQKSIVDEWKKSQTYGFVEGKKKPPTIRKK